MTDLAHQKAAARKSAIARRASLHHSEHGQQASRRLLDYLAPMRGKPVSGYMPIRTEIDLLPAMTELTRFGPVAVPVITGPGQPLEFHRWTPDTKMQDGPFGAQVPLERVLIVPQVVIVPLLAFDLNGHRLGYGGGYYDRTLEILRSTGTVHTVGFAYAGQQVPIVPTGATDQRLDVIITESEVYKMQ